MDRNKEKKQRDKKGDNNIHNNCMEQISFALSKLYNTIDVEGIFCMNAEQTVIDSWPKGWKMNSNPYIKVFSVYKN